MLSEHEEDEEVKKTAPTTVYRYYVGALVEQKKFIKYCRAIGFDSYSQLPKAQRIRIAKLETKIESIEEMYGKQTPF